MSVSYPSSYQQKLRFKQKMPPATAYYLAVPVPFFEPHLSIPQPDYSFVQVILYVGALL